MFLYTSPIFPCPSILPFISPGFPFSPFVIEIIFEFTSSPFAIVIKFPVSISVIPCPNSANLPVVGS